MSLAKLLATGKSVIGGNGAIIYRKDKRIYLPKFGSQKNPFAPAQAESPKTLAENPAALIKKTAAPFWAKTQKVPATSAVPKMISKNPAPTWAAKLNPISLLLGSQSKIAGQSEVRAVQVELSLEKVKVVYNDLTDAEVEIVPVKSRQPREADAPALRPAKQSWEV